MLIALIIVACAKKPVVVLDENNFVSQLLGSEHPWLVLFKGRSRVDEQLLMAVTNAANIMREEDEANVGIVYCDTPSRFCEDGFGMTTTPWLVLFNKGPFIAGVTFV